MSARGNRDHRRMRYAVDMQTTRQQSCQIIEQSNEMKARERECALCDVRCATDELLVLLRIHEIVITEFTQSNQQHIDSHIAI
jgi:hypothetical protein